MSAEVAVRLRHLRCVVVNDAFRLAPWAEALAAQDPEWWRANRDALAFAGSRYSMRFSAAGVSPVSARIGLPRNANSGLLGLHIAIERGASKVLLYGFDLRGDHYFGRHRAPLKNTGHGLYAQFIRQFADYARTIPKGVQVRNATVGSALGCFPTEDPCALSA